MPLCLPIRFAVVVATAFALGGCAPTKRSSIVETTQPLVVAKAVDPKAELTLDQIAPDAGEAIAAAPATAWATTAGATTAWATTAPSTQPSLDALEYYARGRASLAAREPPYAAVTLLEKAAQFDPHSAAVQYQLAKAYLAASLPDKAMKAFERAVAIKPDWLEAQHDLARLQVRYSPDRALRTLIIATKTHDYATNDGAAAAVDYDLARLLQQNGHERAAIEQYEKLLWRLSRKSLSIRGNPQVAALARRPEPLQVELARLYERRGKYAAAISLYQKIAETAPDAFEPQARLVRVQLAAGEADKARQRAGELVRKFRASPPSIELLRDVYRADGADGDARALQELQKLQQGSPDDQSITLALVELLAAQGREADAESLIASAATQGRPNIALLRRLVRLGLKRGDASASARAIVAATVRAPKSTVELAPLWSPLVQSWRPGVLRPDDLARLAVAPEAEAAKQYWLARVAAEAGRNVVSRAALQKAIDARPIFAAAWLLRVEQIWLDQRSDDEKKSAVVEFAASARSAGDENLALMIEAISAARSLPSPTELPLFAKALQSPGIDPPAEFQLAHAVSLFRANQTQKFEQAMWKLISDYPAFDQGYLLLIGHYTQSSAAGPALKVVNTWLANDPTSVGARLEQADALIATRQEAAAEVLLADLADETDSDPAVLNKMRLAFAQSGRMERFLEELGRRRRAVPKNGNLIQAIVLTQIAQGQTPAAVRELEAAAADAAGEPNLLYFVANVFHQLGEKLRTEELMAQALQIDPRHVACNNDLAYFWIEAGKELPRAEAMARIAVAAEPDNSAYLDTLGWALYKQGRFNDARGYLATAVDNASPVDPVLIDHYADVLYRLGDTESAAASWRRAQELLGQIRSDREEYTRLRVDLQNKLRQRAEGVPVEVAPIVEARTDGK